MGFVWASARKDLARWWQDAPAILIWLSIPFLIGGLLMAMAGSGGSPTGILMIADEDDTILSGLVTGAYSQDRLGELIRVEQVSVEEGDARINAGDASGFLIIPAGFQQAFLDDEAMTLTLKTNPSQTILPGIIQDVTEVLLDLGFYARQLLGDELDRVRSATGTVPDDTLVATVAVNIQNRIEAIAPKLFPPILELEFAEQPADEPEPNIAFLFLAGICLMAMLITANGLAGDYWVERDAGTLRRLVSAPGMLMRFVAGKAVAAFVVIGIMAFATLVAGFAWLGVAWSKLPSSWLWTSVAGVGLFGWFAALQMLFANERAADLTTSILLLPLLMVGGSFFPLATLPGWIATIGRLSPNGYVADKLGNEFNATEAWTFTGGEWLVLLAMTLSGLVVCGLRLGHGFARK